MDQPIDRPLDETEKMLDDLVGPLEDWTDEEIDELLAGRDKELARARTKLFNYASGIANDLETRHKPVPKPIAGMLRQFRPWPERQGSAGYADSDGRGQMRQAPRVHSWDWLRRSLGPVGLAA